MIIIVDYGLGNLRSVWFKLKKFGVDARISADEKDIEQAGKLILPGVGAFETGMNNLKKRGLVEVLTQKVLLQKTPLLGICLGMQLLTKHSEEGDVEGLGWVDAVTKKFPDDMGLKLPQMGWNTVKLMQQNVFTQPMQPQHSFYFVHGYHVQCNNAGDSMGRSTYGIDFDSMIHRNNIYGTQFHPEKSHKHGVELLIHFCKYVDA